MGSGFSKKKCYICRDQITWKNKKGFCQMCSNHFHCGCVVLLMKFDEQLCYNCFEVCNICKGSSEECNHGNKGKCINCKKAAHIHKCMVNGVGSFEGICNNCKPECGICRSNTDVNVCCLKCRKVYHKNCYINFPVAAASWVCSSCEGLCSACNKETTELVTKSCVSCKKEFHESCFTVSEDQGKCAHCRIIRFAREVHKIKSQYNQEWVHERIEVLTTQVLRETGRMQNVEVSIYINNDVHVIGSGRDNRLAIMLREKIKTKTNQTNGEDKKKEEDTKNENDETRKEDNGIDVEWEFKTTGKYLADITKDIFLGIKDVLEGLWKGIVNILQGVTQVAIAGSKQLSIQGKQ